MTKLEELRAAIAVDDYPKIALIALAAVKELERRNSTTWLTPIAEAYESEMGKGSFPYGQGGKALSPLYKAGHEPEKIAAHLGFYLRGLRRRGEGKFASLPRFVQTFNEHDPSEDAFPDDEPV